MLVYHNYMFIFRRFGCSLLIPHVIIVIYSYFQTSAGIIFAQALKWLFDITILKVFFPFFSHLFILILLPSNVRTKRENQTLYFSRYLYISFPQSSERE